MGWRAAMTCLAGASGVLGAIAACDSFGSQAEQTPTPGPDAAGALPEAATGTPDADTSTARCDPTKPFSAPVAVKGIADPTLIIGFRLTSDEKVAYFSRKGKLFRAPMLAPSQVSPDAKEVSLEAGTDAGGLTSFSISDDGTTIYYEQWFELWSAKGKWEGPYVGSTRVPNGATHAHPFFDSTASRLYASKYKGNFDPEFVAFAEVTDGAVGAFAPIVFNDVDAKWASPVPGATALYLSGRLAGNAANDTDVFRRQDGVTTRVAEVSTTYQDSPTWVSRDDCILYVLSNKNTGYAGELFVAMRPK